MTAPLDIPALRALIAGATPGPWAHVEHDPYGRGPICYGIVRPADDGHDETIVETDGGAYPPSIADAAFIAASRQALPAALDRIAELEALAIAADVREAEIIAAIEAALVGPHTPAAHLSAEVARMVDAVRIARWQVAHAERKRAEAANEARTKETT